MGLPILVLAGVALALLLLWLALERGLLGAWLTLRWRELWGRPPAGAVLPPPDEPAAGAAAPPGARGRPPDAVADHRPPPSARRTRGRG
jgi:hypothetical protein